MPYYKKKFKLKSYPEAENYFNQAFCLPIYPGLSKNDLKYIVANINKTARDLKL